MIVRMWNIGWFGKKGIRIDFSFYGEKNPAEIHSNFCRIFDI